MSENQQHPIEGVKMCIRDRFLTIRGLNIKDG